MDVIDRIIVWLLDFWYGKEDDDTEAKSRGPPRGSDGMFEPNPPLRIIERAALADGVTIRWLSGKIRRYKYIVVEDRGETLIVKEPVFFGMGHFVDGVGEPLGDYELCPSSNNSA